LTTAIQTVAKSEVYAAQIGSTIHLDYVHLTDPERA
jgi:hypothetical protein